MPNEARKAFIQTIFNAFGVNEKDWTTIDTIAAKKYWIIDNMVTIEANLPKSLIGNLAHLSEADDNRTLMSFIRRLCQHMQASIVTKRLGQKRSGGRCHNIYAYKVCC